MAQDIIYWKFDTDTLYIRGEDATGYTVWNIPSSYNSFNIPWYSNRESITSVVIETIIDVTKIANWFYGCEILLSITNFSYITNVTDMSSCFNGCEDFNQSITIPSSVTNMYQCFNKCYSFDSQVTFQSPSSVTNMSGCFADCKDFNQSITIPSSVTNMYQCFYRDNNFDSQVIFQSPSSVTNMSYCFYNCKVFNQLITIPSSVTNMNNCFSGCYAFNQSITIPSSVTDVAHCFDNCSVLNSQVTFQSPSSVTNMAYCFRGCFRFNQLITIPNSVTNMNACFNNCSDFNKPITIPSSVTSMYSCFNGCKVFNQSIIIPSGVTDMSSCFNGCKVFNQPIIIPSSVTDMSSCFYGCSSLNNVITINSNGTYNNIFTNTLLLIFIQGESLNLNDIINTYSNVTTAVANCAELDTETGYLRIFYTTTNYTNGQTIGTKKYYTNISNITGNTVPKWYSDRGYITKIIIETVFSPKTAYALFSSGTLTEIEHIEYLNTFNVTIMDYMFYNCQVLTRLDVSGFNTSNVTTMNYMFYNCQILTTLDVSGFNTSNVTNMGWMFSDCRALTSLDVSGFDTSKVTDMYCMFSQCNALLSPLDVSHFNTSNVTNMADMFQNCYALTSLDVSGFDTSKVTNMRYMFSRCYALLSPLDVSDFNTSNVTDMTAMFQHCRALTSLDVSGFDTSKVTDMSYMFIHCHALTSLNVSGFNTSNVTNMHCMFQSCYALTSLDVSHFNTLKVTDMSYMFGYFLALTGLDISNFVFSNNTNINSMFEGCTSLTGVIRINSNPGSYTDMFKDTVKEIVLLGSSTLLNSFTTTANNHNVYVWSLTAQPTANRDDNVGTSVNLSVKIQSYAISNDNVIQTIKVYEDDSTNPLTLTWDKSFAINENPKTFTTTITGIDENTTVTYRIQVEDNYGVSSFREVMVPTNYYTIDFLNGGKEISFGEKATESDLNKYKLLYTEPLDWDSNWTNYYEIINDEYISVTGDSAPTFATNTYYRKIESLFKCKMETAFDDMDSDEFTDFMSDLNISDAGLETTQADWVVEQGINGIWTWRKWQSGIAECWGDTGIISLTNYTTTFSGNGYGYTTSVTFPSDLFVSVPILTYSAFIGNGFGLTGTLTNTSLSNISANLYAVGSSSGTKDTRWLIEAKGRWK